MEKVITMIMPTYNHPSYIKYFLENSIANYSGEIFNFEIHDSSENDETQKMIFDFNETSPCKVKYFRYNPTINGDKKTFQALCHCCSDYMYLMGDGVCPDFDKLESYLLANNFQKYDLLGIFPYFWNSRFKKDKFILDYIYDKFSVKDLFLKFFHEFTFYGGSIVSKKIWNFIYENKIFDKFEYYDRYSFAYVSSIFSALSLDNNFKSGVSFISFFKANPLKKESSWGHGKKLYEIGLCEFENDIFKLPQMFSSHKKAMIKKNRHVFFNLKSAMSYRISGNLNFKILRIYKKNLKNCIFNYYTLIFVSLIPIFLLKIIRFFKKRIEKLWRA